MVESQILEKDAGPSPPPLTSPFQSLYSARHSLSGSVHVVRPIMPTSCCLPCVLSSAATWKKMTQREETPHDRHSSPFGSARFFGVTDDQAAEANRIIEHDGGGKS